MVIVVFFSVRPSGLTTAHGWQFGENQILPCHGGNEHTIQTARGNAAQDLNLLKRCGVTQTTIVDANNVEEIGREAAVHISILDWRLHV